MVVESKSFWFRECLWVGFAQESMLLGSSSRRYLVIVKVIISNTENTTGSAIQQACPVSVGPSRPEAFQVELG